MLIFQNAATLIPLWVAVIGMISSVIASLGLGGVILFILQKKKFFGEVQGIELKNKNDRLKNVDYENEVFAEVAETIKKLRSENNLLASEKYSLERSLHIKELQIAEANGKVSLSLQERDDTLDKFNELENKIRFEHNQCQEQIKNLGLRYEAKLRYVNKGFNNLLKVLSDNNIEVPAQPPFDETEELKGLITNEYSNAT